MRTPDRQVATDEKLDAARRLGDPPADDVVAAILGTCEVPAPAQPAASASAATCDGSAAERLARVKALNKLIGSWGNNAQVAAGDDPLGPQLAEFIAVANKLPDWACPDRIQRAQLMFMDQGVLSVTALFCASLPDSYVLPDLAAVLHATGQLDSNVIHRIRATGAMIFPVMMMGGLVPGSSEGGGIAQILKVRLIHAMVRNLILRTTPEAVVNAERQAPATGGKVPKLAEVQRGDAPMAALHVMGWDIDARGVPNDQEELAYTLLTFSYVFLRAMRDLDIPFSDQECEDYLHAWNVAGYFLGIDRDLTVDTMEKAAELYGRMQKRGRERWAKQPDGKDPRPHLAAALMEVLQNSFTNFFTRPIPVLLTRRLIGTASSRDLQLDGRVAWWSRFVFWVSMGSIRLVDRIARLHWKDFSLGRLVTRAVGHQLLFNKLMDLTDALSVPGTIRPRIATLVRTWGEDKRASPFMNSVDDRFNRKGEWVRPPTETRGP